MLKENTNGGNDVKRINENVQEPKVQDGSVATNSAPDNYIAHAMMQRAISNPRNLTANEILTLQRTIGNKAVQRILKGDTAPLTSQNKNQVNRAYKGPNLINRQASATQEKPQNENIEAKSETEAVENENLSIGDQISSEKENSFEKADTQPTKISNEATQASSTTTTEAKVNMQPAPIPIRRKLETQTIQREDNPSFSQNVGTFLNVTKRGKDKEYKDHTNQEKDQEQWIHAAMMENSPIMAGGPGHLIQYGITHSRFKKDIEARKAAINKNHIIEENMYGDGKVGSLFRIISAASRAMHLIASLAGIGALITGIIGIWHPYVLPISTIFGLISFAANGALAILRSILIARNIYRIKKMPGEKDKILPTLYRDIASLVTSVIGMAVGGGFGFGAGAFLHATSTAALQGAELSTHIAGMSTEFGSEAIGATANSVVAFQQGMNEANLGAKGRFGQTPLKVPQISGHRSNNAGKFLGYFVDHQPIHYDGQNQPNNAPLDNSVHNQVPVNNLTNSGVVENTPVLPIQDNSVGQVDNTVTQPIVPVNNTVTQPNIPVGNVVDNLPNVPVDNTVTQPNVPVENVEQTIPNNQEINKIHLENGPKPGQKLSRIIHREFDESNKGSGNSAALEELNKFITDTVGVAPSNREFLNQRTTDLNDAVSGLGEINQATSKVREANKIQEVSNKLDETQSKVENDKDKSKAPKSEQELDKQEQGIKKAESEIGTVDKEEETPKPKQSIGTRIKNWFLKRFSSLKKRAAKLMQKLNAKITGVLLKVTGLDKQLEQAEQIANEEKQQAPDTLNALNAGKTSLDQYEQNVEKLKELAGKANGSKK